MSFPPSAPLPQTAFPQITTSLPTVPLPPSSSRTPLTTARLLIRPLEPSDLPALHAIRSQPEVMINTPLGVTSSPSQSQAHLSLFLPPNDISTFNFAICLNHTGEMIGIGGCHSLTSMFGWPVVGYQLRKEYWGQGLATEFLRGWLGLWAALPRGEREVRVHPGMVAVREGEGGEERVEEVVCAWTVDNVASQRVLEKGGFELCLVQRERDLRDREKEVELRVYRYFPGRYQEGSV